MNRSKITKAGAALAALTLTIALGACSSDSSDSKSTSTETTTAETTDTTDAPVAVKVTVTEAWARSIPGGNGAIYGQISSTQDDALISASIEPSSYAGTVEVHEVVSDDAGMMKMQKVDRVQVKAGVPTELKPGSYHIMMTDMPETLPIGTEITVTAVFEKAGPVTFKATVTENSMPDMGGGMMSEESDDMMSGEMND